MDLSALALIGASWIALPGAHPPAIVEAVVRVVEGNGSSAVFTLPLIRGEDGDTAVAAMNSALSWESVTGGAFSETADTFASLQRGYTGSGFTVNHNSGGILDIALRTDFLGAYPSTSVRYYCFDVSTGRAIRFQGLLRPGAAGALVARLDSMLQANIAVASADSILDPDMYGGHRFGAENLENFSICEDGVLFHYDFGFPHAVKAAEPDGELFIPAGFILPLLLEEYAGE